MTQLCKQRGLHKNAIRSQLVCDGGSSTRTRQNYWPMLSALPPLSANRDTGIPISSPDGGLVCKSQYTKEKPNLLTVNGLLISFIQKLGISQYCEGCIDFSCKSYHSTLFAFIVSFQIKSFRSNQCIIQKPIM